jgi:hypothetical protein
MWDSSGSQVPDTYAAETRATRMVTPPRSPRDAGRNPTLTIGPLAVRQAEHLLARVAQGEI